MTDGHSSLDPADAPIGMRDVARPVDVILRQVVAGLGYGSVALGIVGMLAPQQVARLMNDDPDLARPLSLRDALIGVAILRERGPASLVVRGLSDVSDAVRLHRRSPLVALGAFGVGVVAFAAAYRLATRPLGAIAPR